jgi:predicted transcriptional regulator of viral defense system
MRYIELRDSMKAYTIFSTADIRRVEKGFQRRRLNEWQDKGYIKKIIKGYYIFSDIKLNENIFFEVANRIYQPSYVSFQSALSYHRLIPESVYGVTSASSRRTYIFKTKIAEFIYRTIKPELFFGYDIVRYDNKGFRVATPEKALLDYFYINTSLETKEDFKNLRINRDIFLNLIDKKRLFGYLGKFKQKKLTRRIKAFLNFIKYA